MSLKLIPAVCSLLCLFAVACGGQLATESFYKQPADAGAGLSANGVYPQGRKLAFMGYSGEPGRELTNGFTVAGPVYGNQLPYLALCESNGWPVVAHVGLRINFLESKSAAKLPGKSALQQEIRKQVTALAGFKEIVWWAVTPEELRPWVPMEMNYLKYACEAIRESDPQHRPIYLYNPNHRSAETLAPIARQVDIVAKGSYVNLTGRKRERAWVQWSIEQEIDAIGSAGRPGAIPLLNPELCQDPEPAADGEIRNWVRHDIYLGLASGAKGVLIWSLYPRATVQRTWQRWYDAYAECGRELNGPRALGQVFLFGERRRDLKVRLVEGETVVPLTLGGKVEAGTTSDQERAARQLKVPSWTSAEFAWGDSRWLFIINSANTPSRFVIEGWPACSRAENAFTGAIVPLREAGGLPIDLTGCSVFALRFRSAL